MTARALLLTSTDPKKNKYWTCSITSHVGSMMPPADILSTAAMLREQGVECRILDLRLYREPWRQVLDKEIQSFRPDATLINLGTPSVPDDYPLIHFLRDKVERRIAFGYHAMALPQEAFENGITHVLVGDPEFGAAATVRGESSQTGVWTPGNTSAPEGRIADIDEIPMAAWDMLKPSNYHSILMGRGPFSIMMPSRGCSYRCPYCTIPFLLGSKVRWQSPKRVVDEMERDYREYGIRSFFFVDAAINLRPKWTVELCETILERNLPLRWCSNMRVPPVKRELLDLMKRAGCFRLFYGVEDLDMVAELDRRTTMEQTREAFQLTHEAGIESVAFLILFPGHDKSERQMAKRMLNMARDIRASAIQVNVAIPFPGCQMFEPLRDEPHPVQDWAHYDPAGNVVPYECELDLIRVRRMVYLGFYLRHPVYLAGTFRQAGFSSLLSFARSAVQVLGGKSGEHQSAGNSHA